MIKSVIQSLTPLLAIHVLTCHIVTTAQEFVPEQSLEGSLRTYDKLRQTREGLVTLQKVLHEIDQDLEHQQHRACFTVGDINCQNRNSYGEMNFQDWIQGRYESLRAQRMHAFHQIKRSSLSPYFVLRKRSSLDDLDRKRRGLEILKRILREMDTDLIVEQKRMCRINLGGHCATESAAAVADQWHYLNSPLSPGKRKRRDLLENSFNNDWQLVNRYANSGRNNLLSKLLQAKTSK